MHRITKIAIVDILWPVSLLAQTNFYVSTKGNDAQHGTQNKPFASVTKAVEEARKTAGSVVINMMGGTYYMKVLILCNQKEEKKWFDLAYKR